MVEEEKKWWSDRNAPIENPHGYPIVDMLNIGLKFLARAVAKKRVNDELDAIVKSQKIH
jgi:hypothetical protein